LVYHHDIAASQFGISRRVAAWIAWSGFAVPLLLALGMALPATREPTVWFVQGERHPVEILTAIALFGGGFLSISLTRRSKRAGAGWLPVAFFGFFTFALFLVALEEISWGQWIYRFPTPEFIQTWNQQGETSLHNAPGMQGKTHYLRLVFGLGGLFGVAIGFMPAFRSIGVPLVTLPWFLSIASLASLEVYVDPGRRFLSDRITTVIFQMGEATEMLIAVASLLYVALRRRQLENA
jgi:small basic protein